MSDPRAFLTIRRRTPASRPVDERLADHRHPAPPAPEPQVREQAGRCMDCGVAFCHHGCPLGNHVPDWNRLAAAGRWEEALRALERTNSFPELTGLLCPAPCEEACVLSLNDEPVTIKAVELAIAERSLDEGWIRPRRPAAATGRRVAVIGSGPAGMSAAQQLTRAGHAVTVYERDDRPGGLLRHGIPDFKLEKGLVDARIEQMLAEGTRFETGSDVGRAVDPTRLMAGADAVVLATGAQAPRPLDLPGAGLDGVVPAMAYLRARNRALAGLPAAPLTARGRQVVVLGGGDTSADCLGFALREGAASVVEVAHGPQPPAQRSPLRTWPAWPAVLRTYPAHEEGGERAWAIEPTALSGADGRVSTVRGRALAFPGYAETGLRAPVATGEEVVLPADLVLVAIGFAGVEDDPVYAALGAELAGGRVVRVPDGVAAAGDCVRGADLIVTAIADGRRAAAAVDARLRAAA